jgi:hypothetical protein
LLKRVYVVRVHVPRCGPGANPLPADVIQVTLHSAERLGSDYLLGTPANLGCLSGALKQHIVLGMLAAATS